MGPIGWMPKIPTRPRSTVGKACVAAASDDVIVDHASGLHEGIDDRGAAEFEPGLFQVFRDLL